LLRLSDSLATRKFTCSVCPLVAILLLGGCTSNWRAPMEVYSGAPARSSSTPRHVSKIPRDATYYRVRSGDTLYAIAWRANRDFRQLARWNGIRPPYVIYQGQVIRLQPIVTPRSTSHMRPPSRQASPQADTRKADTARDSRSPASSSDSGVTHKVGRLHWGWPSDGKVVSTYEPGDPLHKGIKIAGRKGSGIRAAEAGKVVYSGSGLIGYGRLIIIKHNDKYLSAYGHNSRLLVQQNQHVTKGQKIAEMGTANDGRAMLHFEIRQDGKPVNPMTRLPRR
jgi:lipoprotein NlpD